jgi:apolipoprotein N-acyltransferase
LVLAAIYLCEINKKPVLTAEIGKFIAEDGLSYNYTNSAILIEKDATVSQFYSKIHLAPIGEWFPYERWLPGLKDYLESMGASSFILAVSRFSSDVNGI